MINLIKDKTGCHISVGQNGYIWLAGEYEDIAEKAIRLVEEDAPSEGLTDRVAAFLQKEAPAIVPRVEEREGFDGAH